MISDFFPFYPKRPYPVCPVPSRVVEVTLRKQEVSLTLSGPHLILVLSGIAHFGVEQALLSGDHPAGTVLFSLSPGSYTIGSGSAAVCSLCIYGFDVGQKQSGQCCASSGRAKVFPHILQVRVIIPRPAAAGSRPPPVSSAFSQSSMASPPCHTANRSGR